MDLRSGDEILTTTQDYPRMLTTLRQRERREGLVLRLVKVPVPAKKPSLITDAFAEGITDRTRVILISHMINITGQITPVADVCRLARAKGIEVIVDGAHSFAQFDFRRDDLGCDYFGTSLHKWLFAPKGTGLLYVRRDKIASIWPLMAAEEKQAGDIRKFEEIGTHSAAPRLAIGEAILFHRGIGPKRKEARLRHLSRYWMNNLKGLPNVRFNTSFDDAANATMAELQAVAPSPDVALDWYKAFRERGATCSTTDPTISAFLKSRSSRVMPGLRAMPAVMTTMSESAVSS